MKLKRNILLALLFFGMPGIEIIASDTIDAARFGAVPDDGKDDTKALQKAIDACRIRPGASLFIKPGVYQIRKDDAIRLEKEVLAGKMGSNPEKVIFTPYYPYEKGLDLTGLKEITIKAERVVLLCDGWMEPISMDDCNNILIKGVTIDYKRKPFSSGEVTAVYKDYFEVQFSEERTITQEIPLMRLILWDKTRDSMYPKAINFPKKELLGNNKVRFHHQIPEELSGSEACVVHSFHFRPGILILNSQNITLEDVTIHSQPGMGIVGFNSKDILMKRLAVVPAPGYYMSTNTDATHFASCGGLLRFEGCSFKGHGDDATNVHGYYQTITNAAGNRATIEVRARTYTHAQIADVPDMDDEIELVEIKTLKTVAVYRVKNVYHQARSTFSEVILSENLPDNFQDYYLMNVSKLPRLEFENSIIDSHLSRGILIKTRNVLINNNVFRNGSGTAIHVGAESYWKEGSHAKNVVISNNLITGCGGGAGTKGGASGIAVMVEADEKEAVFLHENIRIENNLILGEGDSCGIYVANAKNVVLKNNQVVNCKEKYITEKTEKIIIE